MSSHIKMYFDADGNATSIVCPKADDPFANVTDEDFLPHDNQPGRIGVKIAVAVYGHRLAPLNIDGRAVYHDLSKAILADVIQVDPVIGGKLQVILAAIDAQIAVASADLAAP